MSKIQPFQEVGDHYESIYDARPGDIAKCLPLAENMQWIQVGTPDDKESKEVFLNADGKVLHLTEKDFLEDFELIKRGTDGMEWSYESKKEVPAFNQKTSWVDNWGGK